jgi:cytochrome c peroxidase
MRVVVAAVILLLAGFVHDARADGLDSLPNNFPHLNPNGFSATFSTRGFVDLTTEYSQAQGSNGRSCQTCHIPQQAWSINPSAIQLLFFLTGGTHPIFNALDADNPETGEFTTVGGRLAAYTMMLTRGVFRRGGAPRTAREWDLIAVDDPHGYACLPGPACTSATGRIVQWRRAMPTINFHVGSATVNWDGGNSIGTDQLAGLENQARRNVTGGQQGPTLPPFPDPLLPPFDEIIPDIVNFETSLSTAQIFSFSAGFLNAGGALGGPEALSLMPKLSGAFDLFLAWTNSPIPARAQIARGQALFNAVNLPSGRSCNGCHNSKNNGTSIGNVLFDIGTASAEARTPDLPLYTLCRRVDPAVSCVGNPNAETRQLTDTGRGNVTGAWNDLGRFKTPTLRALAQRAPYFHNGIAATIEDVVTHYEDFLGFVFTHQEREDLVAFLKAL